MQAMLNRRDGWRRRPAGGHRDFRVLWLAACSRRGRRALALSHGRSAPEAAHALGFHWQRVDGREHARGDRLWRRRRTRRSPVSTSGWRPIAARLARRRSMRPCWGRRRRWCCAPTSGLRQHQPLQPGAGAESHHLHGRPVAEDLVRQDQRRRSSAISTNSPRIAARYIDDSPPCEPDLAIRPLGDPPAATSFSRCSTTPSTTRLPGLDWTNVDTVFCAHGRDEQHWFSPRPGRQVTT